MSTRNFSPIRDILILVVAWLLFVGSVSLAAKRAPSSSPDEEITSTIATKESLIREFDVNMSMSGAEDYYTKRTRKYVAREIACLLSAVFFAVLTYRKGYEISDQTGRPAVWGGVVAVLSGPLCFALHVKPK